MEPWTLTGFMNPRSLILARKLGVEGLFKPTDVTELFTVLSHIRARAA
jgi:hypothetical protein